MPLVAGGGAAGTMARYGLALALPDLVLATLLTNLLGCLLLGLLVGTTGSPRWRLVLGTGVLGGFTTMSTLAVHVAGDPAAGLLLLVASVGGGLALAAAGRRLAGYRPGSDATVER